MKKLLTSISLCAFVLSSSAQFKVQSDGKIAVQTTSTATSPISINCAGSSSYYIYCSNTSNKSGLYLSAYGNNSSSTIYGGSFSSSSASTAIGLRGNASTSSTSIGVLGNADVGTKSMGLLGCINQNYINTGAGVYGTVYGDLGSGLSTGDKYAGFFRGNVKATGSIVAGTTIQGALLGESSNSTGLSANIQSLRSTSVIGSLSMLNVTTYQKERPALPEDIQTIYDLDEETDKAIEMPKPDIMDEQFYEKNHFALDADRLEEAFPDLVYVNKEGSKVINYMEMIPLLVQSINELSEEIAKLKQVSEVKANAATRGTTNIEDTLIPQNKLYQNTPNPFKEQTIIRFSLTDDAKDAAICIFDMTGKTIKKLPVSSGMDSVSVGGYELGEGMFLYSLIVNGQEIDTKKMIISK
mgnify:CR=1 FL=1